MRRSTRIKRIVASAAIVWALGAAASPAVAAADPPPQDMTHDSVQADGPGMTHDSTQAICRAVLC